MYVLMYRRMDVGVRRVSKEIRIVKQVFGFPRYAPSTYRIRIHSRMYYNHTHLHKYLQNDNDRDNDKHRNKRVWCDINVGNAF